MYMTKRFNVLSLWPWNFMKLLEIEARIISHISYQLPMYEKLLPFSTTNAMQPCSVVSRRTQPCLPQIRSTTYVRHTTAWAPIVWHKTILGKQKLKKKRNFTPLGHGDYTWTFIVSTPTARHIFHGPLPCGCHTQMHNAPYHPSIPHGCQPTSVDASSTKLWGFRAEAVETSVWRMLVGRVHSSRKTIETSFLLNPTPQKIIMD